MATRKFSSKSTSTAPAAPAPSLPILAHERQAEARESIRLLSYGLNLLAALVRTPAPEASPFVCGIEVIDAAQTLIRAMQEAAARVGMLLALEAKESEATEAANRG